MRKKWIQKDMPTFSSRKKNIWNNMKQGKSRFPDQKTATVPTSTTDLAIYQLLLHQLLA